MLGRTADSRVFQRAIDLGKGAVFLNRLLKLVAPEDRLRLRVERIIRASAHNPHLHQIMVQENADRTWRWDWIEEHVPKPEWDTRNEIEEGSINSQSYKDPVLYYTILVACVVPYSLRNEIRALSGQDVSSDEFVEAHTECVLRILNVLLTQNLGAKEADIST